MTENMIRSLIFVAISPVNEGLSYEDFAARYQLKPYDYIEVHYHGVVNIHRDLKRIVVSQTEAAKDEKAREVYRKYFLSGRTPLVYVH
jgi:hypothetical protein